MERGGTPPEDSGAFFLTSWHQRRRHSGTRGLVFRGGAADPRLPAPSRDTPHARQKRRRPREGGDVAIYVRDGRHFEALSGPFKPAANGTTEVCGVRLLGAPDLNLINIYRPPIRSVEADERIDHFDPDALPDGDNTVTTGDINAHHPLRDSNCEEAD